MENEKPQYQPAQPRIDWQEIHKRLERVRAAIEERPLSSPQKRHAILKERARSLAGAVEGGAGAAERLEVIEFLLAYERYAVELDYVREVYSLKQFTPLPGTPPFVVGIVNVRGRIVSVIDLKKFFGLPAKGLPDLNRVIIINDDKMEFGILADALTGVRNIEASSIQPSLPTLSGIRREYLKGVTADRLVLLDAIKLLQDPKIKINQSMEPTDEKQIRKEPLT